MKRILIATGLLAASTLPAQEIDTQALWKQHCLKCHGAEGKAETKMGKMLKIRDYSDPKVQEEMKDEEILAAIRDGVTKDGKEKMKGYSEKLSEQEIEALTKMVRDFGVKKE